MLKSITFHTNRMDGSVLKNVATVNGKAVGDHVYPKNKKEEAFCERMCDLEIFHTVVQSWGDEELAFCITDVGQYVLKMLK